MISSLPRWLSSISALVVTAVAAPFDREIVLTPHGGTALEDLEIARWQQRAETAGSHRAETWLRLGWAYVAKARRTSDVGCYKLAEKTADVADAECGVTLESRLLRGHVLHQLHRFRAAEVVARELVRERGDIRDWALLSDVLVEQGRIAEGAAALQRMVDLKPGLEAFSRIAHVRWLTGDMRGAIDAAEQAVRASSPRQGESHAWAWARLSGFYLQAGETERALAAADTAMRTTTDYAPAELARGRALFAAGARERAVSALRRAVELNPLPEYQWWLADGLRALGRSAEAALVEAELVRRGENTDPRTLALFLATRGEDVATAVRLAQRELAERADVHSHDALAWALAASGNWSAAEDAMRTALAAGTRDPRLFLHAAEIARARGDRSAAETFYAQASESGAALLPSERTLLERGRGRNGSGPITDAK